MRLTSLAGAEFSGAGNRFSWGRRFGARRSALGARRSALGYWCPTMKATRCQRHPSLNGESLRPPAATLSTPIIPAPCAIQSCGTRLSGGIADWIADEIARTTWRAPSWVYGQTGRSQDMRPYRAEPIASQAGLSCGGRIATSDPERSAGPQLRRLRGPRGSVREVRGPRSAGPRVWSPRSAVRGSAGGSGGPVDSCSERGILRGSKVAP